MIAEPNPPQKDFESTSTAWLCQSGSLTLFWLASKTPRGEFEIIDARLEFGPRGIESGANDFSIEADKISAGIKTFGKISATKARTFLKQALEGQISFDGFTAKLSGIESRNHYSESLHREDWARELKFRVCGSQAPHPGQAELLLDDTQVRRTEPAFDGVSELAHWIGVTDRRGSTSPTSILIVVRPPADLIHQESSFRTQILRAKLIAHRSADLSELSFSIRGFPGKGIETRRQLASEIKWSRPQKDGFRIGTLAVKVPDSDSVLTMLTLRNETVRRHWFVDPDRAVNIRYTATATFDKELKQLRSALLESTDSARFETATATLLFLLGFECGPQLEKDAPDLIAATPNGQLIVCECTTRTSDLNAKIGKLVDRKRILAEKLIASGQTRRISGLLVTAQARANIAVERKRIADLEILLVCREELEAGLTRVRIPQHPDELLDRALQQLQVDRTMLWDQRQA